MNKRNFDTIKYQLPALLWAIFILGVCTYPFSGLPSGGWLARLPMDKLVHCFLFFVWCYLMVRGAAKQYGRTEAGIKHLLVILSIALIYGIAIELIQHYWTTKRTGDVWDVAADIFGSSIGLWIAHFRTKNGLFKSSV